MAKRKKPKAKVTDDPGLRDFLRSQEKLTEDYLGNAPGKRTKESSCAYTLFRGPNEELFLVSKKKVIQVKDQDQVDQFLNDLNQLVSDYISKHLPKGFVQGPGVHVGTSRIFPK
jgi:hypothetical protein